jgi:NAD(P)-dependent dehydrogenase (short-subunit alcohol dehydrogenase family)
MRFSGARVLVTGAASGLGAALAQQLEGAGAQVLRTDVRADSGRGIVGLDVTSDGDWAAALDRVRSTWGGLDILVNNAGVAGGGRVDRCTVDEWRWITEINLYGAVRGTSAFAPLFKEQRSGCIVNVASLAALVHPAGMGSYNAVKAAVLAFTETTGHELAAYGITAHAVCPSYFRTNLMQSLRGSDEALGTLMRRLVDESPTTADDIAHEVLAGLERGEELILPDAAGRAAYALKVTDRAAYDQVLRRQAAKLDAVAGLREPPAWA